MVKPVYPLQLRCGGYNDCISIDSDYNDAASLSNSSVYNPVNSNDDVLRIVCLNCCGIKTRLEYSEFRNLIQSYDIAFFFFLTK
jgi:hypothetical protein